ncbi:MAG: hypothetical protein R3Y19_05500 [Rikenellaceae bacterium]
MFFRIKKWWDGSTFNEKLMYALVVVLLVCIATRWRYIGSEIVEAFSVESQSEATR